ncbi:MAG: peptidylprolyl isomerase [bacterium]
MPVGHVKLLPVALAVLLVPSGPGCKKPRTWSCPKYKQVRRLPPAANDTVVARVNGHAIAASEVRSRMQQTQLDARAALEQLIDEELLFQEAERRGIHKEPAVVEAGKQAAVYRLLAETFEKEYTKASVPDKELRRVYKAEAPVRFHRPEHRHFGHAYLTRPWFKQGKRWLLDEAADRKLKQAMLEFHKTVQAEQPRTWEQFQKLTKGVKAAGQELKTQDGVLPYHLLRRPFANALWALELPGEWSGLIVTRRWYHVAFLLEIKPRLHISYEDAKELIREKVYPFARRKAFQEWVDALRAQCRIVVKPEHLPVETLDAPATARRQ